MAYRNMQDQTEQQSTALVQRLTTHNLALTDETKLVLLAQGIPEEQLPIVAAGCLSIGIPPNVLRYTHNVPKVMSAVKLITELGYRPGQDFFVALFKSKQEIVDEDGIPTGQKPEAPTVVVMPSAARIETNAKDDARIRHITPVVETGIIEDQTEARQIFDDHFKGDKPFDEAIVAYADLYQYHERSGLPLGSGRPQRFYGFFVPNKFYTSNGKTTISKDWVERQKAMSNYEAPEVAKKRAGTKAWRALSRTNYPIDNRTATERLAAMLDSANTALSVLESVAKQRGISVEDALQGKGEDPDPLAEILPVSQDNADLWDEGDWEEIADPNETPYSDGIPDTVKRAVLAEETVNGWMATRKPFAAALEWAMGNMLFDNPEDGKRHMAKVRGDRRPSEDTEEILTDFYNSLT